MKWDSSFLVVFSPSSTGAEAGHPSLLLASLLQKEDGALHSDRQPLRCRGPHTSYPANWGLAPQPRLLTPAPPAALESPASSADSQLLSANHQPRASDSDPLSASSIPRCVTWTSSRADAAPGRGIQRQIGANIPVWRAFCWRDFLWAFMPTQNNYCSAITGCGRWNQGQGRPDHHRFIGSLL